jgi:D-3-phosphoglycerate dehydrogenase
MIGHLGNVFGGHGINISAAAVGREPDTGADGIYATMVVITDQPVPDAVVAEVVASPEFVGGRSVTVA